jgi:hypothetical protein
MLENIAGQEHVAGLVRVPDGRAARRQVEHEKGGDEDPDEAERAEEIDTLPAA